MGLCAACCMVYCSWFTWTRHRWYAWRNRKHFLFLLNCIGAPLLHCVIMCNSPFLVCSMFLLDVYSRPFLCLCFLVRVPPSLPFRFPSFKSKTSSPHCFTPIALFLSLPLANKNHLSHSMQPPCSSTYTLKFKSYVL